MQEIIIKISITEREADISELRNAIYESILESGVDMDDIDLQIEEK